MKKKLFLIVIVSCFLQLSCENKITNHKQNTIEENNGFDVSTMATPDGERLKAAQNGPVRSALGQPEIDLASFKLTVDGMVDSVKSYNWQEIQDWNAVFSDTILMYCVEGWEVWGKWKGMLVKDLLLMANPQTGADFVLFHCAEGYTTTLPISYLEKYQTFLAYEVNGEPLQAHDGFPLRLISFGMFGYKWAKWVNRLELIHNTQLGFWEKYGYADIAHVPLERRKFYEGEDAEELVY
jgi:DMSO/TMAO reductase YedYZ molybdopterin-dependent catalytic subunit